jgi:hypothetical protein
MRRKIMKNKTTITKKRWDANCEYCGATPEETEVKWAYASNTAICGDIDCWNSYCLDWVWSGEDVEVEEYEVEVCEDCEEEWKECHCEWED